MKMLTYAAALALLVSAAGCSDWFGHSNAQTQSGQTPFSNGLRTNQAQATSCSPADSTCGTGIGNPSVQSPVQKRELNTNPPD